MCFKLQVVLCTFSWSGVRWSRNAQHCQETVYRISGKYTMYVLVYHKYVAEWWRSLASKSLTPQHWVQITSGWKYYFMRGCYLLACIRSVVLLCAHLRLKHCPAGHQESSSTDISWNVAIWTIGFQTVKQTSNTRCYMNERISKSNCTWVTVG